MEDRGCCFSVISRHRSVRSFSTEPIPQEDIRKILEAARRHVSPWNIQPVHVTVVTDSKLKSRLSDALWGQEQIKEAPVFFVFSVDYAKVLESIKLLGLEAREPGLTELLQGYISASVALAWSIAVAEDLGYVVNIIAAYGNPCEVADILGLPSYVVPVAGLLVGKPKGELPPLTPRAPVEALAGWNSYGDLEDKVKAYMSLGEKFVNNMWRVHRHGGPVDRMDNVIRECLKSRGFRV
ncbi:NADH dehydrogenase [Aeropyrum pernix K1]|uniref:NADH dehydrogenase n=1 Tax=Aeropyrum pernix (strain ATCC 700893 / DSM 11879 / JCM 9820 / NBRC 100138 / K1) TaxID=272557 RepID=Q9YG17_AERPE|nr:nitroreductase family protein [Aeropyrum pernix]BAA78993.2 NADH dehydrogenase [Aeropyrum pernix K1]